MDLLKISNNPEFDDDIDKYEEVGNSTEHQKPVGAAQNKRIDDALGLEKITIRLQKELVVTLKLLAKSEGIGYQPYIRQVLTNHAKAKTLKPFRAEDLMVALSGEIDRAVEAEVSAPNAIPSPGEIAVQMMHQLEVESPRPSEMPTVRRRRPRGEPS